MAARTRGWAQLKIAGAATNSSLHASTDQAADPTFVDPPTATDRSDGFVFLIAGQSYDIRWGGIDEASAVWGAGIAANRAAWRCDVMAETTQTSAASDSTTIDGAGGISVDRTFTFTPSVTGTYRLKVNLIVTVTATGTAVANDNTDNGNFGSAAPSRLVGATLTSFTPGLLAVGTTLSTPTRSPSLILYPIRNPAITVTQTFPFAVGSGTSASAACTVSYRDADGGGDVEFAIRTITATTSANKTDSGLAINNTLPAAQQTFTNVGLHFSFNNSALSTALGGAGVPWSFVSGTLPSGWLAVTSNSIGATEIRRQILFQIDPRVMVAFLNQKPPNVSDFATPPLSKDQVTRVPSDLMKESGRFRNALDEGLNSLSGKCDLWDLEEVTGSEASPTHTSGAVTTQTVGGEVGWLATGTGKLPTTWDRGLPGGTWIQRCYITSPSTLTGLEISDRRNLTLLAVDETLQAVGELVPQQAGSPQATHWKSGAPLLAAVRLYSKELRSLVVPDSTYAVLFSRDPVTDRPQYLDASFAWVDELDPALATQHALAELVAGTRYYGLAFTGAQTAAWVNRKIKALCVAVKGGIHYADSVDLDSVGPHRGHDDPGLEWAGVAP